VFYRRGSQTFIPIPERLESVELSFQLVLAKSKSSGRVTALKPLDRRLVATYAKNGPESYSSTNDDLSSERQKILWKTP
jgi:hypothetical protein